MRRSDALLGATSGSGGGAGGARGEATRGLMMMTIGGDGLLPRVSRDALGDRAAAAGMDGGLSHPHCVNSWLA